MATSLASVIADVLGEVPIAVETYEGDRIGQPDARATLVFRSPDALRRILTAPGELGLGRAYVAGDLDVEGDIFDVLSTLRSRFATASVGPRDIARLVHVAGLDALKPLAPPEEEAHLHGLRHSRERDAAAIAHHYDVSNAFYRLVLGPSMTYSCAVWSSPDDTLEVAQAAKHDLICRKLGLREGMRLLDIGCGWGGMVLHAARHHGVEAVGVTLSREQAEWGRKAVAEAGLADRIQIREQDYRDVRDGPFDAISSIGMFEHVGLRHLDLYFRQIARLLRPEGRLLNHGISRPAALRSRAGGRPPMTPPRLRRRSFVDRYVFPDGELHEIGPSSRLSGRPAWTSATSRTCASTTPSRCGRGSATSRPVGTRRWSRSASPVRGSGGSTWPHARWASRWGRSRCTRCSRCGTTADEAGCRSAPTGEGPESFTRSAP